MVFESPPGDSRNSHLQIGKTNGSDFGKDRRHLLMIGCRCLLGQNLGIPIAFRQAAFQYNPARESDFLFFTAFATASISPDSG